MSALISIKAPVNLVSSTIIRTALPLRLSRAVRTFSRWPDLLENSKDRLIKSQQHQIDDMFDQNKRLFSFGVYASAVSFIAGAVGGVVCGLLAAAWLFSGV